MKILDYLYYHLVQMIKHIRLREYRMEQIPDQAAYSLTIGLLTLSITLIMLFNYYCLHRYGLASNLKLALISLAVITYFRLRYIYIYKNRYQRIVDKEIAIPETSYLTGRICVLIFLLISYFSPFLVAYILK